MGQAGHGTEGLSTARDSEFSAKTNHPRVANPPRKAPRKMRQTLSAPARLPVSTTPQPPPTIHTVFSTSRQVSHSLSSNNFKKKKKNHDSGKHTHASCSLSLKPSPPPRGSASTPQLPAEEKQMPFFKPNCCLIFTLQGPYLGTCLPG